LEKILSREKWEMEILTEFYERVKELEEIEKEMIEDGV
jgi:hypothetical protein